MITIKAHISEVFRILQPVFLRPNKCPAKTLRHMGYGKQSAAKITALRTETEFCSIFIGKKICSCMNVRAATSFTRKSKTIWLPCPWEFCALIYLEQW